MPEEQPARSEAEAAERGFDRLIRGSPVSLNAGGLEPAAALRLLEAARLEGLELVFERAGERLVGRVGILLNPDCPYILLAGSVFGALLEQLSCVSLAPLGPVARARPSLAELDAEGFLPPGVHSCSWEQFAARFGGGPTRLNQLLGLRRALQSLRDAGCRVVFVGGSFVTAKREPADVDVLFDPDRMNCGRSDPVFFQMGEHGAAQRAKYGGQFFPLNTRTGPEGIPYLEFFQLRKGDPRKRGVVRLDLSTS